MARTTGSIRSFTIPGSSPEPVYDWDGIYEDMKRRYKPAIDAGNVGYDDRTKMFHVSVDPGWNEWALISYNLNRLAVNSAVHRPPPPPPPGGEHLQRDIGRILDDLRSINDRLGHLERALSKQPH